MTGAMLDIVVPPQQGDAGQRLGDQIRADVQRAVEEATRAAAEAQAAGVRAALQEQGVAPEPGTTFRVDENGRIVPLEEGGAVTPEIAVPPPVRILQGNDGPPPEVVTMSIAFFIMLAVIIVGLPIARAMGRRMDRQGAAPPKLATEQAERIARIEQAVDAMAIEVERISEGQRFVTKLLTERALPEGQAAEIGGARRADPLPVGGGRR